MEQNGGDLSKDESSMEVEEFQEVAEAAPVVTEEPAPVEAPAAPAKAEPVTTTPVKAVPVKVASPVVAAAASPAKPVVTVTKPDEPAKVEGTAQPEVTEASKDEAAAADDEAAKPADAEAAGERKGVKRKRYEEEPFVVVEDEPEIEESLFCLDWYNSDLSLKIDKATLMSAEPLYKDGWGYVW
jgi:hypothetical protein